VNEKNKFENNEDEKLENDTNEENLDETLEESEVKEDQEFEELDEEEVLEKENKELNEKVLKLSGENKILSNKLNTVQNKHLSLNAEYDNFRKRTVKEKEKLYTDSCTDVLKEIFPVIDNLERALAATSEDSDLKKGVEMTLRQFQNAMEKLNVEVISTDCQFDPNIHNAIMHEVNEDYGENEIIDVFQKGYKRGEKILRHSMVKVAN
jgi:molecular chaperone GrpE